MNKFGAPTTPPAYQPRSRSSSSRNYSTSGYSQQPGSRQTTTSRTFTSHTMTYSALPKPHEPPVNSVEYYQMQQIMGNPFTNIQQAAAPAHIQHTPTGFGALRDRFKTGSLSDEFDRAQVILQQQRQQHQVQRQTSTEGGNTLSSIRNQYMNRTKETTQDELPTRQTFNISRTIVGEDIPQPTRQQQPPLQMQPPPQVLQKQADFAPQTQQQQPAQATEQEQQNGNVDQSEVAPPSTNDNTTTELPVSSF